MLMAIFEKSTAQRFMDCLKNNKPLEPADKSRGWTGKELWILASVLFSNWVWSIMEARDKQAANLNNEKASTDITEQDKNSIHYKEHQKAEARIAVNECCCALRFMGPLVGLIENREYDINYPEKVMQRVEPLGEQPDVNLHPPTKDFNEIV
jgi:hypothetical protein